jgi:subtilisin family serine protease
MPGHGQGLERVVARPAVATVSLPDARQAVGQASRPASRWTGPEAGPPAQAGKTIAVVAEDLRNGGIVGVAPEVTLVPLKVIGPNGAGSYDTVAEAITYAADHQAAIISISLAGRNPSQVLADAVAYAAGKGCLVVAAMGNEASSEPDYPAACPGAMAVGATDDHDYLPNFENTGPYISVVAPGIEILSTMPKGRYDSFDGTSASVPFVSGIAALLKSQHPSWTGKQLRARIEQTADDRGLPGPDEYFGFGRVNAGRASSRS